jgi:uncharacterized glyoxalase superfamily protein PhnB
MPVPGPVVQLRVALTASDYTSLVDFYCGGLGIDPTETWTSGDGHGLMLDMGRATLEIFDAGYARFVDEVETGAHVGGQVRLALQVPDVVAAVERLLEHGATLVHPPVATPWGDLNARVQAPDGMQVALFQAHAGE